MEKYLSLVKFGYTIIALPFTLIGYFLGVFYAGVGFNWLTLLLVLLSMIFAFNVGMAFNRYIDRDIDAKNPRTANRPIPSGIIKPREVLVFVIVNAILFVMTCWFINSFVFFLSPIAILVILGYSLSKKITLLCHFLLGFSLSMAPMGAYLAVTGAFDYLPMAFSFIIILWRAGTNIVYALQDADFDAKERLYSIPAWLGIRMSLIVTAGLYTITGISLVLIGIIWDFGKWYAIGTSIFIILLVYQQMIVKPNDLSRVNTSVFTVNVFSSVLFAVFVILDIIILYS